MGHPQGIQQPHARRRGLAQHLRYDSEDLDLDDPTLPTDDPTPALALALNPFDPNILDPDAHEVDVGLAADVGTLARLPKVIGSASLVSELALTAVFLQRARSWAMPGLRCSTFVRRAALGVARTTL